MKQVAIILDSPYGQTAKIGERILWRLTRAGYTVHLFNLDPKADHPQIVLTRFDAVIIGGPIYVGKFPHHLTDWTRKNAALINLMGPALFSVSLNAADPRPEARTTDARLIEEFAKETGIRTCMTASFKGAIHYREYGPIKRWLLRRISKAAGGPTDTSRDHELTDWGKVDEFADAFALHLIRSSLEAPVGVPLSKTTPT